MKKWNLKWALYINVLIFIFIIISVLASIKLIETIYFKTHFKALRQAAMLVQDDIKYLIVKDPSLLEKWCKKYKERSGYDFEVFDQKMNRVSGSFEVEGYQSDPLEVKEALKGSSAQLIRYNGNKDEQCLYAAIPLGHKARLGVLSVSVSKSMINGLVQEKSKVIYMFALLVIVGSFMLTYLTIMNFMTPLVLLKKKLRKTKKTGEKLTIPQNGPVIVKQLTTAVNRLMKRSEKQYKSLLQDNDLKAKVIENIKEGMIILDHQDNLQVINEAAKEILEKKEAEIGTSIFEVIRIARLIEALNKVKQNKEEQDIMIEIKSLKKYVNAKIYPIVEENKIKEIVIIFLDLSKIMKLEKMRKEFVSNVSHELKTPITLIKGFIETLADTNLDESEKEKYLSIVSKHTNRLNEIIDDLLKLSALDQKNYQIKKDNINLLSLLEKIKKDVIEKEGHVIDIQIECEEEASVEASSSLLQMAIANIITNGIKYNINIPKIKVNYMKKDSYHELHIEDNGIGMSQDHISRIFERFYRVDQARSRELGGTGLGLALVKHIMQAHNGAVEVKSEESKGSVFILKLKEEAV